MLPGWIRTPADGVHEHVVAIPDAPPAALLAAHAKVLALLSGDRDVLTEWDGRPHRLTVAPGPWASLIAAAQAAEPAHGDGPCEAALGSGGADAVLHVSADRGELRVRARAEAFDAEAVGRIARYHRRALELSTADPGADQDAETLLDADEVAFQRDELAGPRRDLPDRRWHELFEERVAEHPDRIAAEQGDEAWSYAELDARANRIARALLARGLGREDAVAVVLERNLRWMASTLAVFKAGGVYLPVEPHLPPERVAWMLRRAGCRLALTEPGSAGALAGLPEVDAVDVEAAWAEEGHAGAGLGVPVAADQLAYLYFTSGSTGEPKGAECEHIGMLNHLLAKIEDLEIGPGHVVAQTAPQCFDISLWQLVAALVAGGRTRVIAQDTIMDVERFVDELSDARVNVCQVVPSYLDAVLASLERRPRELPDLRFVSVTGEALKAELAQRFFAVLPHVKLVNAYGLTETCDDTNHEIMDHAPDRVVLGPAVRNVRVAVVDERLRPVPLGAPGEIVFSGVCVGRGYVNDPERTRQAFLEDPSRPGERLYRSGDHGRWRPDGKLEFLGRRDGQVKLRGFRIEIGEVENALLRAPGVRDGTVVVAGEQLVGFYTAEGPVDPHALREALAALLPAYMVPAVLRREERLPLTANGKVDRRALTVRAGQLDTSPSDVDAPRTPSERRLAAAWAEVLGVPAPEIGRRDHFFDRGGSSLSAVKLAVALDKALSLRELTRHPVLADMAALLDGKASAHVVLHAMAGAPS